MKKALVFGGTGFLGSYLIGELCSRGFQTVLVSRTGRNFEEFKTMGFPGQVTWKQYDVASPTFLNDFSLQNFDIIINLIGIWEEKKANIYQSIHAAFPLQLACLCKKYEKNLIHISGFFETEKKMKLPPFIKTKKEGEAAVRKHVPKAVIINPGWMIGKNDILLSHFEKSLFFLMPFIFRKNIRIKPLSVSDAAIFIAECSINPAFNGKTYTLFGPESLTFREIALKVAQILKKRRIFIAVPGFISSLGLFFKRMLPSFVCRTRITGEILSLAALPLLEASNDLGLIVKSPQTLNEVAQKVFEKYELYD